MPEAMTCTKSAITCIFAVVTEPVLAHTHGLVVDAVPVEVPVEVAVVVDVVAVVAVLVVALVDAVVDAVVLPELAVLSDPPPPQPTRAMGDTAPTPNQHSACRRLDRVGIQVSRECVSVRICHSMR